MWALSVEGIFPRMWVSQTWRKRERRRERERVLSRNIHLSLVSDCGCSVTNITASHFWYYSLFTIMDYSLIFLKMLWSQQGEKYWHNCAISIEISYFHYDDICCSEQQGQPLILWNKQSNVTVAVEGGIRSCFSVFLTLPILVSETK